MSPVKFDIEGYRTLLNLIISKGYSFSRFRLEDLSYLNKNFFLRHDVDNDLGAALDMALVEKDVGVKSTYFVMLRSPLYNILSRHNFKFLKQIQACGHDIGLHYDANFNSNLSHHELLEEIYLDVETLNKYLEINLAAISFHQPSDIILKGDFKIEGILNTYNKEEFSGIAYFSDSNKNEANINKLLKHLENKTDSIQLLIHPMWWVNGSNEDSTENIWNNTIVKNFNYSQVQILETERSYGKKRIFSVDVEGE